MAVASSTEEASTSVKAIVTVKLTVGGFLSNLGLARVIDDIKDLVGETLQLELVSTDLDPSKLLIQQNYTPNNLTNQTSFTTLFKVYFNLPNADYESRMHACIACYLYIFLLLYFNNFLIIKILRYTGLVNFIPFFRRSVLVKNMR
jgi:hypothetical protein